MNLRDFQERLALAHYGEAYVAARISAEGFGVYMPPLEVAQTEKEALDPKWKLTVDLYIKDVPDGYGGTCVVPVEVKSQSERFTSPETRRSNLVCSAGSFKPSAEYIFLSKPTAALVWLPKNTEVERKLHTDTLRGETYAVMVHPPGALRSFEDFIKRLKGEV